jgi:anti-anti-sigma factor
MASASGCVKVDVPLDIAEVDRVHSVVTSAMSQAVVGSGQVVLDLTECDFVDVVGYRMLSDLACTAEGCGVTLQMVGASVAVLRVITILDAVLTGDVQARVVMDAHAPASQTSFVDSASC